MHLQTVNVSNGGMSNVGHDDDPVQGRRQEAPSVEDEV